MTVTAQMVKELREKSGAGMMDCKKTLVETEGNMDKAIELLRQKGISSANKKMGRLAAEGLIVSVINDNVGVMIELNCETDFVAKNEEFKALALDIANLVSTSNVGTVDELLAVSFRGKTLDEVIKEKISTIGEKITVRKFVKYEGNVATYIHNGKIGVLLLTDKKVEDIAKDVCLHIASSAPEFISKSDVPKRIIDEETRIEMGKEDLASKPEAIRGRIVEGRVQKLMAQRCLLEQPFVKSPNITIQGLIEGKLIINKFDRFVLGEGLEKRCENFAEEVMNQINKEV